MLDPQGFAWQERPPQAMQVNVEKLSPVLVELQVQVPADRVRSEIDKAYSALQRTARVKGFRPGKAPRDVLAHIYGGRINADVSQRLIDETLNQALAAKQVQALAQLAISPDEIRPTEAFSYKARFEVRPEIPTVKWEGLAAQRPSTEVTDDMIDHEVELLQLEHATLQAPAEERGAKQGDVATVSFQLEVDGITGGEPHEVEVEVGGGKVMKELEAALPGMKVGEQKDVPTTFPETHQSPELRGKSGIFHMTLKDVRERILPELDDELAKDCGEDSMAKLREAQKAKLEKALKHQASHVVGTQLMLELCKSNPIPLPPSMVDQQAQASEREYVAQARRRGQRLELNADMRARIRMEAEINVRTMLLMGEIAREKQMAITDADIERGYHELAEDTGKNVAKVKAEHRDPKKREQLVAMLIQEKVIDLIEAAANITTAPPGTDFGPAYFGAM